MHEMEPAARCHDRPANAAGVSRNVRVDEHDVEATEVLQHVIRTDTSVHFWADDNMAARPDFAQKSRLGSWY